MSDDARKPVPEPPRLNETRRRLLRGGAAASPILWAITTRPALAATECVVASAAVSLSASGRDRQTQICSGRAPAYWSDPAHFDKWPHPYYAMPVAGIAGHDATQFHAIGCSGGYFGGLTMLEVLQRGGGGEGDLGPYIVAGVLNAAAGMTPVLDVPSVLNLWNECDNRGFYEPTAGVQWTPSQVVEYLKTTISG